MKLNPDTRWEESLSLISKNTTPQQYDAWFKPLVFESYDDKTHKLVIQAPSMFVYEYLEENYAPLFKKALSRTFGTKVKIGYRIVADKEHQITQTIRPEEKPEIVKAQAKTRANQSPTMMDAVAELDSQLNPEQTFDNFLEGLSNKLTRQLGLQIAEHPQGTLFNPMFIFGPSGCGKTHLVNAMGVKIKEQFPQKRVLYVSARLFQVQYTDAVLQNTTNDFINFYQTIDVLIVDDIQEWLSATKTQDTFFHIFNHLFRNGKRIILASDRPPVDLKGMNDRLLNRFACGLIAEMERPSVELCRDILRYKIEHEGLEIPDDVVQYIAETANGSVRDLQGVVNSLLAYSVVYNCEIDMQLAERIVKRSVKVEQKKLTVQDILGKVCDHFNVSQEAVCGKSRKREIVEARQVTMFLAQKHTNLSATSIGKQVANRDHSTVLHSCAHIEHRLKVDRAFNQQVIRLESTLQAK